MRNHIYFNFLSDGLTWGHSTTWNSPSSTTIYQYYSFYFLKRTLLLSNFHFHFYMSLCVSVISGTRRRWLISIIPQRYSNPHFLQQASFSGTYHTLSQSGLEVLQKKFSITIQPNATYCNDGNVPYLHYRTDNNYTCLWLLSTYLKVEWLKKLIFNFI